MTQYLACDIGFGSVKNCTENRQFKFPSAVAVIKSSFADITDEHIYDYNGVKYLVGEHATREALITRDYIFLEKYAPILLYKAINDAGLDLNQPIKIATGLSLLNWSNKKQFADALSDFTINHNRINNLQIKIIPQGKGTYVDCLKANKQLDSELVIIVDIGFNTLDVIPFENGRPLAAESWATTHGMNTIISELQKYIVKNFGVSHSEAKVNQIYQQGYISISGENRDLSVIIDEEKRRYAEVLINKIQTQNSDLFNSANTIIISGGGAYALDGFTFNHKQVLFPKTPYEFSNVRGYYEGLING